MTIRDRRDSFCGKMSVCNNLRQYRVPFTLTTRHTDGPDSATFLQDLADFAVTCRVLRALKGLRIGARMGPHENGQPGICSASAN
jgi:L-fucose isomerase-like protein